MNRDAGHRAMLIMIAATTLLARQGSAQGCPVPVDSVLIGAGPVFQACEVDKPARRKGVSPATSYQLSPGQDCAAAIVEFVVEADGKVGVGLARVVRTNDQTFARQMLRRLERTRYTPAHKEGAAVRQFIRDTLIIRIREVAQVPGSSVSHPNLGAPCL